MMLSDVQLKQYLSEKRIRIAPSVRESDIRPTGIRVHLSEDILVPVHQSDPVELDGSTGPTFVKNRIGRDGYTLQRGEFILGVTKEIIAADAALVCQIDGRSTLARLGLMIHCGSTIFDHIQSSGRAVTLELANVGPFSIKLTAGHPIALVTFMQLSSPVDQAEYQQYVGQDGPVAPRLEFTGGEKA
jgi:dCTP deaminase